MRFDVPSFGDDLQSSIVVSVYFGGNTAGNIVAVLIRAYPLARSVLVALCLAIGPMWW